MVQANQGVNTLYRRRHYGMVNRVIGAEDMRQENKTSPETQRLGGQLCCLTMLQESETATLQYLSCGLWVVHYF